MLAHREPAPQAHAEDPPRAAQGRLRLGPAGDVEAAQVVGPLPAPHANIVFEEPVYLGPGFSLHIPDNGNFIVGSDVEFRCRFRAEIYDGGTIRIGAGSYLTYDAIISCSTTVEIGERCGIGQNAYITDGNHKYRDLEVPFLYRGYDFRPIKIEDDAQIHSKVTVINDIGERAIIGANAVITRSIPPYTVAAGIPAKVIDYFGPPGSEPAEWLDSSKYGAAGPSGGSTGSSSSQAARRPGPSA